MERPLWRFYLFAVVAIVLPAAIVAVLGYVSLRQWETSSELLFREQAREMATMAADKIEMVLRRAEDDLLGRLAATLARDGVAAAALQEFLAGAPLVRRLYVFDRPDRRRFPEASAAADEVPAATVAQAFPVAWEPGERRHLVIGGRLVLAAALRDRDGGTVLAALVPDVAGLGREIFDKSLGGLEAPVFACVLDARGEPVWTRKPLEGAEPVLSVPFRQGLPEWRLAIFQPHGASPRASVRRQVMLFTMAFAVLLIVIVVGLMATWRLVRRETEMAQLKADFVANVSHDLKTPLSVIRMFGETLEMERVTGDAARREYYRVITREAERLSRLIDNVLDFSRIERGRRRYDRVPTAVGPLVRETLEAFEYPLGQRGFAVDTAIAADLPAVPLDADAVGQALANLVDNAIKYSADRTTLRVEARVDDGHLVIAVADQGIGIPAEEQARIFEKFYRIGRSETQGRRGSGVGLALVRHVAEAHGGRVTVESRAGEGSTFTMWFPLGGEGT